MMDIFVLASMIGKLYNLKLLCDEVFGEENFVNNIVVKSSEASGLKMSHIEKRIPKN